MKKAMRAAGILTVSALLLAGCAGGGKSPFPPQQSAIYVTRDGGLYTARVENLTELFSEVSQEITGEGSGVSPAASEIFADQEQIEAELREMAGQEAAAYSGGKQSENPPVGLHTCQVKDQVATVVYQYRSAEDLLAFTEVSQDWENHPKALEITTVGQGLVEGKVSDGAWVHVEKNTSAALDEVMKQSDLHLISIEGTATVQTEGKILYYSGPVSIQDPFTAEVTEGKAYLVFK